MPEKIYRTADVFGIHRDLPLNYTTRQSADDLLLDSLTRDKHLVIYGSSKQGKTSLRKHCLRDDDYITVHCSNKWDIAALHAAVLKKAGYEVTQGTSKTVTGRQKIFAKLTASFLAGKAEGGAEAERTKQDRVDTAPLELDPEDVNDIIQALCSIGFTKFIVLEDFHYLSTETQKDFSVALKAFHENSKLCFIVIGVWLEENRLTVYNGDLTGRVTPINADKWTPEELDAVVKSGEALLHVSFAPDFRDHVIANSFDSVYILQEACYRCCVAEDVNQTQNQHKEIGSTQRSDEIIRTVVNQQTGRFNSFLTQFSDGFQDTQLQMYRWLLYPVLLASREELEVGLRLNAIRRSMQTKHPQGSSLNPGNITQALQSAAALQVKKDIKPIILDYDQTNLRLNVVDKAFLIWLETQERKDLLELVDLPTDC
ncbi:hypothetical protein BI364_08405 [Acidihalobacter yilgarnensis]|uniref:Orc1-like AAA ATPase domain-containing protein n=2 Tax=Acidihalobacter yilgarnensis TaxID=2819280 RepID=A0A1D8INE0_9GAMM|nr:hypothetical protein BI364_08405 [Acidihalobacter yilgarnensis]